MPFGGEPDADVVVPRLVRPGAGRVAAGQRVHLDAPIGQVVDRRGDLADELHLGALRRPHPQLGVGDPAAHRVAHQLGEDRGHLLRLGDDVDGAEQRLRDPADLRDLPVDPDAAAVALELAGDGGDRAGQLLRRLVVVLAVGQQDRVPLGRASGPSRTAGRPAAARCPSRCRRRSGMPRTACCASYRVCGFICTMPAPARAGG